MLVNPIHKLGSVPVNIRIAAYSVSYDRPKRKTQLRNTFLLARILKFWHPSVKLFSWQTFNVSMFCKGRRGRFFGTKTGRRRKGIVSQGNNMTSNSMSPFLCGNRNQLAMMFWIINSKKRPTAAHFLAPPISACPSFCVYCSRIHFHITDTKEKGSHFLTYNSKNSLNDNITEWRFK